MDRKKGAFAIGLNVVLFYAVYTYVTSIDNIILSLILIALSDFVLLQTVLTKKFEEEMPSFRRITESIDRKLDNMDTVPYILIAIDKMSGKLDKIIDLLSPNIIAPKKETEKADESAKEEVNNG